jgi:hypothetical protein
MKKKLLYLLLFFSFNLTAQTNDYSLEFDGNDMISIINSIAVDSLGDTDFSYHLWFKKNPLDVVSSPEYLVSRARNSTGFWSRILSSGRVMSLIDDGPASNQINTDSTFYDDTWHFLAVVADYTSSSYKVYIDGYLEDSVDITINTSAVNVNDTLYIGGIRSNTGVQTNVFKGKIDDVAFWNKALTTEEINQYMNCPLLGSESSLIGFWNFEQGSTSMLLDQSTNNNTSIIIGNPTWSTDVPNYGCIPSSLSELNNKISVKLFPNPVQDVLNIETNEIIEQIEVFDITGKQRSVNFYNNQIQTQQLPIGMYVVRIYTENGQLTKRFVKQ